MKLAEIRGHVTATVKHESLHGQRLLIAQPVNADGDAEGAPQVVIDPLGCAHGQRVLISSDGAEARKIVADSHSPARWFVAGIVDAERGAA
ncbi:MAG: EutN/CcmL family microcompartment protein [Verrucomicrobiales bacterium]|jgi:ethanolamine utilization protein EutN|nr:EutN/CcmL family microcompartment protein [Verrucomicrobiales bacterium]